MIDDKYYIGYEGETEVIIYYNQNNEKFGLKIWNGYFENLLIGCYDENIDSEGIIACYKNQIGFYDEPDWKVKNIETVISELENYKENENQSDSRTLLLDTKKLRDELLNLLKIAKINGNDIYIDYD